MLLSVRGVNRVENQCVMPVVPWGSWSAGGSRESVEVEEKEMQEIGVEVLAEGKREGVIDVLVRIAEGCCPCCFSKISCSTRASFSSTFFT